MIISTREGQAVRERVLPLGVSQISGGSRTSVGGYEEEERPTDTEQFDVSDQRTLDEVVRWLMELGYIPSFCTACYREGRTGDRFMSLCKSGQIQNCCHPNALMTLKEYLMDYAAPETKAIGGLMTLRFVDAGSGLFHELHAILNGEISEDFGSQRIAIWRQVWKVIREQPLWGSGPDTLELWGKGFQGYSAFYQAHVTTLIDTAHNEYLNIWVNQGIFALIAYFTALVYLAWKWIKYAGHHANAAICGCAVLCYCVQAFFGMSSCITAPYFWMLLGMLQYEVTQPVCDH